jgi:hypothetical protein
MGGYGSGRTAYRSAGTCDDYKRLDIRALHRSGRLTGGVPFSWQWWWHEEPCGDIQVWPGDNKVTLKYRTQRGGDPWKSVQETIWLDWTTPHLGGRRPWFLCPGCGQRVAILYAGHPYFRCRGCLRLVHTVCHETLSDQLLRKAWKLRRRAAGDYDTGGGIGDGIRKPKGMHRRTFERLYAQADVAAGLSWAEARRRFGLSWKDF